MSTTSPAKYSQRPSEFLSNSMYSSSVYVWCGIVDMALLLTHQGLRHDAARHTDVTSDENKNSAYLLQASIRRQYYRSWCWTGPSGRGMVGAILAQGRDGKGSAVPVGVVQGLKQMGKALGAG